MNALADEMGRKKIHWEFMIDYLKPGEELVPGPNDELLGELGNDQERAPAPQLLRLENVAVYVVAHVQNVLALGAHQFRQDVARPAREDSGRRLR